MPDDMGTVWDIEDHTIAKHKILKRYVDAWLPILTTWTQVLFIDGFAGPGIYRGGEPGSPIIVLKAAVEHRPRLAADVTFFFIEKDPARYAMLVQELDRFGSNVPPNFHIVTTSGTFDQIEAQLDSIHGKGLVLVPTLAFVDPFGVTGFPMRIVRKLLRNPRTEIIVTFMVATLDRFAAKVLPAQASELFGSETWADCAQLTVRRDREVCLVTRYRQSLKDAGARYTLTFEMVGSRNLTIYYLVYATSHKLGMEKMKEAMAGVDPSMNYRFSDLVPETQRRLFDFSDQKGWQKAAAEIVWRHFEGREMDVREVKDFVVCDEDHVFPWRVGILRELLGRNPPGIEYVTRPRRRGFFPEGTVVRFPNYDKT